MTAALLIVLAAQDGLIASPEPGWAQWRGPRRDGISEEKGLLQEWPKDGPKLLWTAKGLGRGWSSAIVSGGRIFVTGDAGTTLTLFAFDLEGKPLWSAPHGRSWEDEYPGARASAAVSEGRVYLMNAHGRVGCFDAATGRELWAVEVLRQFEGRNITWALSECLLVDGPRVIVTPGGRKALLAALDKATGATVWTAEPLAKDDATYASPILLRHGGRRIVVTCSSAHGFAVDADSGKLLWTIPLKNQYGTNCSTPAYAAGQVHFATAFTDGACYRLTEDAARVEPAWKTPFDTSTGGWIVADGLVYGGGYSKFKHWIAVDWKTGETRAALKELRSGSAVLADGRLHILAEDGRAALVAPVAEGFKIAGEFRITDKKVHDAWAHPALLDRRLYLRYHDELRCYSVAR